MVELKSLTSEEALEEWRVKYLGRRGRLTTVLRSLGSLPAEERRAAGVEANRAKTLLEEELDGARRRVRADRFAVLAQQEQIDVTRPGRTAPVGRFHPLTQILREICDAFVSMGFQVVEGPEVEWDHYNFEMLNIPRDHPARDMWNTLWIDHKDAEGRQSMLLRTHTSPMQARTMEKTDPPVRVLVPGKCYRYEATDATHEWHFHQIEGLAVDKGITMAHLKGTLYEFARRVFGPERKVRFRCDYFPFVEPGVDMSIDCFACQGKGRANGSACRVCREGRVDRDSGGRHGASQGAWQAWATTRRFTPVSPSALARTGWLCSSTASRTSASSIPTTSVSSASSRES